MVRLEVSPGLRSFSAIGISIPCGAIRSDFKDANVFVDLLFQFLVVRLEGWRKYFIRYFNLFQFLVVRLEVHTPVKSVAPPLISIPCGAIRSFQLIEM